MTNWNVESMSTEEDVRRRLALIKQGSTFPDRITKVGHVEVEALPVYAMAERSGHPVLDKLIEEFKKEKVDSQFATSWDSIYGPQPERIDQLVNPDLSEGRCDLISRQFAQVLTKNNIQNYFPEVHPDEQDYFDDEPSDPTNIWVNPDEFGYQDRPYGFSGDAHCLNIVYIDGETYTVDWTASQYGYTEFPMVQRLNQKGDWSRNFSKVQLVPRGGSSDDRVLALNKVASEFSKFGVEVAQFEFTKNEPTVRYAQWEDVEKKAMRLVNEGKVNILRNGPQNVIAQVQGDNGTYQSEILRNDPSSRSIETWSCDCPWNQYAWQRTRQWKKYEGRVCSHVLATYWQGSQTPLDEDAAGMNFPGQRSYNPQMQLFSPEGQPTQVGQLQPNYPVQPGMPPEQGVLPGMPEVPPPTVSIPGARQPSPYNPVQYPAGTFSKVAGPESYYDLDFSNEEEISEFANEVSGGWKWSYFADIKDGQVELYHLDPLDPESINMPTSHYDLDMKIKKRHPELYDLDHRYETNGTITPTGIINIYHPKNPTEEIKAEILNLIQGTVPEARFPLTGYEIKDAEGYGNRIASDYDDLDFSDMEATEPVGYKWVSSYAGEVAIEPMPTYHNVIQERSGLFGIMGTVDKSGVIATFNPDGGYKGTKPLNLIPELKQRILENIQKTVPNARWPENPEEQEVAQAYIWKVAGNSFINGEIVRLNTESMGTAEGKSDAHGAGEWRIIPRNSEGEVINQDASTGWVEVIFPIHDSGPMEPYHIRAFFSPEELNKTKRLPPGPFIRRR